MLNQVIPSDQALFGDLHLPWNQPLELIPFFMDLTASEGIVKKDAVDDGSFKTAITLESAAPELVELSRFSPTGARSKASFHNHSPTKISNLIPVPDAESATRQNSMLESTQLISLKSSPRLHCPPLTPPHTSITLSPKDHKETKESNESKERPRSQRLSQRISESIVHAALLLTASARNSFSRTSRKVGIDSSEHSVEQDHHCHKIADDTHSHSLPTQYDNSVSHSHSHAHATQLQVEGDALGLSPEQDDSDLFIMSRPAPLIRVNSGLSTTSGVSMSSLHSKDYAFSPSRTLALSINGDSTTAPSRRRFMSANAVTPQLSADTSKRLLSELANQSRSNSRVSSPCNSDKSIHNTSNNLVVGQMG